MVQGTDHETVMRDVVQHTGFDSFIDDLSSADSKGLSYQDCEVLFHVNRAPTLQVVCTSARIILITVLRRITVSIEW